MMQVTSIIQSNQIMEPEFKIFNIYEWFYWHSTFVKDGTVLNEVETVENVSWYEMRIFKVKCIYAGLI